MVTIEQKLSMFSNLLHRFANQKLAGEMDKLRKEYEEKIRKEKEAADREAEDIMNRAHKKAEAERAALISRMRIDMKKEYMAMREKLFAAMFDHLTGEIKKFTESEKYADYLVSLAGKLKLAEDSAGNLSVCMTGRDCGKYSELLKNELQKAERQEITFEIADSGMIGGFIAIDRSKGVKYDFSIRTLLEDSRPLMMQKLFRAIEAGEPDGKD
ncbi:MAG: V-type ATP synthase subunit E [Bacillota bacterium]